MTPAERRTRRPRRPARRPAPAGPLDRAWGRVARAIDALVGLLVEDDPDLRVRVLSCLGALGDASEFRLVSAVDQRRDRRLRLAAMRGLGQLGGRCGMDRLLALGRALADHPDDEEHRHAYADAVRALLEAERRAGGPEASATAPGRRPGGDGRPV